MAEFIKHTIGEWLDIISAKYPDNDGLVYVDRKLRLSYKELNTHCRRVAKGLLAMGIKKGDHLAIWATNYPEWIYLLFAASKIGAVLVTVNTNYKRFELEYLLRQSDTRSLFFINGQKDTDYASIVNELVPEIAANKSSKAIDTSVLPYLKEAIYIAKKGAEVPENFTSWDEMVEAGDIISDEELDAMQKNTDMHDVVNIQYTSGTTGFPKGVMLTHYNILNNGFYIGESMRFSSVDRLCIPVPFFHCFGLVLAIMACITHGTTMVPVEQYKPLAVLEAIETEKCTAVHGVPTMYIFMLDHPDFPKYNLSSLRTGIMAGSPCPIEVMRKVIDRMGMREITIAFGQTEASPVCTQTTVDDDIETRVTTVGKALPEIECRVVNPETNEEVPDGEVGEFVCRGYNVMRGYYNMEEATRNAIDSEGWLHFGDLVTRDSRGYYKVTGRIKDMIIRGGENIYPREIEELLYTNDKVADVQVVGVPSRKFGEEAMAFVILKENVTMKEEELRAWALERIARHKVPGYIAFVDEFPMNAAGKIQKYKLREQAIELLDRKDDASIVTA